MTFERFINLHEDTGQDDSSFLLNSDELTYVYDFVADDVYRWSELSEKILSDLDFPRGKNSLRLAAIRMHILVHGLLPLDMSPNPEWYNVPNTMKKFAQDRGIDVAEQIEQAKEDGLERKKSFSNAEREFNEMFDAAIIKIKKVHQDLVRKGYTWLKFSDIEASLDQKKKSMILDIERGKSPSTVIMSAANHTFQDLIKIYQGQQKQRKIAQAAKAREKEIKQRRLGSVWKGVIA